MVPVSGTCVKDTKHQLYQLQEHLSYEPGLIWTDS